VIKAITPTIANIFCLLFIALECKNKCGKTKNPAAAGLEDVTVEIEVSYQKFDYWLD
jgi:hypothetical protein